jgi:hypothetical protein
MRKKVEQICTVDVTIIEIMSSPQFALGVADARSGRLYRAGYGTWHTNGQWNYERGRQWARLAPASCALKRDGKITPEAVRWFEKFADDIR